MLCSAELHGESEKITADRLRGQPFVGEPGAYLRLAPPVAFFTDSPTLLMAAVDAFEICSNA